MKKFTFLLSTVLFTVFINAQCNEPSDVHTEVEISGYNLYIMWTENGSASMWDIEYGISGFSPTGIPTLENLTSTYFYFHNLDPDLYDFYVRADCGTEQSNWVGPFTFCKYCAEPEAFTDFDNEFLPLCWEQANLGSPDSFPSGFGQGNWEQDFFANGSSNLSAKIHIHGTDVNEWLITPYLEAMIPIREETFLISTDYTIALTQHNLSDSANLGSDDQVKLVYSLDYGNTWNELRTWDSSNSISNTGDVYVEYFEVVTNSSWVLLSFWVNSGQIDDPENIDFFIDNLHVMYWGEGNVNDLGSKRFMYYPNPSGDNIRLTAKEIIDEVTLYNCFGLEIKNYPINQLSKEIDISELQNGIYFMRIEIGNTLGVVQVVKE